MSVVFGESKANQSQEDLDAAMANMSQEDMGDAQILMGDVAVSQPSVAQNAFEIAKVSVPLTSMAMGMILFKINKSQKKSDHDLFERLNWVKIKSSLTNPYTFIW